MARDAAAARREEAEAKRKRRRILEQLKAFCNANRIDYSEIRTEAIGHGPNSSGDPTRRS